MVRARPLETVFVDVGGTLRPNSFTLTPSLSDQRQRALSALLGTTPRTSAALIEEIELAIATTPEASADVVVARVLAGQGFEEGAVNARQVRHALCVEVVDACPPFEHAGELLAGVKDLGWQCIVLSNTVLRDAEIYRHDFEALGWDRWVDAYVTSVDVGFSKPDPRIFLAALAVAGSAPRRCAMVGNSEYADIAPAARLGMSTILVAIEDRFPVESRADAGVTHLLGALDVLKSWAQTGT